MRRLSFLVIAFSLLSFSRVGRSVELSVTVNGNFSIPRIGLATGGLTSTPPVGQTSTLGLGLGANLYFPALPLFDFQVGLWYLNHRYSSLTVGADNYNAFMVPVMLRLVALPLVSFAGGVYGQQFIGNLNRAAVAGGIETPMTFQAAGLSTFDFGAILSASLEIPIAPLTSLLADLSGYLGLVNLDTSNNPLQGYRSSGFLFNAGVKFGF